ncbi:MAG: hypothetical protein DRP85_09410, partial [Candidatus Makaraimicrobium thalassicum]
MRDMRITNFFNQIRAMLLKKRWLLSLILLFLVSIIVLTTGCGGGTGDDPLPNPLGPKASSWETNIVKVQAAINADPKANWVAGETWITREFANLEDANVLLGALPVEIPANILYRRYSQISTSSGTNSLASNKPSLFSWLEKDGTNWMTPVKAQGQYGTCVAFACCGALEAAIKIAKNDSTLSIDLSEWYLWYKMTNGKNPVSDGWSNSKASEFLKTSGTVEESIMPYSLVRLYPNFTEPAGNSQKYTLKVWDWAIGDENIKTALLNGPVVSAIKIYSDFYSYNGGVYRHVWGDLRGGHAIVIVGYNDVEQYWICKNSWRGEGWGEKGYFRIAYGDASFYSTAYALTYTPNIINNTPLSILSFTPVENQINTPVTTTVSVIFDKAVLPSTINATTFILASGATSISGSISLSDDGTTASFAPTNTLSYESLITVTLNVGIKDLAGNSLVAKKQWSFTTVKEADTIAPSIVSVVPTENLTDVAVASTIQVNFSEKIDASSVNSATFKVSSGTTVLSGSISYGVD